MWWRKDAVCSFNPVRIHLVPLAVVALHSLLDLIMLGSVSKAASWAAGEHLICFGLLQMGKVSAWG